MLEGKLAFTVISDLHGEKAILDTVVDNLPEMITNIARENGIRQDGINLIALIGDTPGNPLLTEPEKQAMFRSAWAYLRDEFAKGREHFQSKDFESKYGAALLDPAELATHIVHNSSNALDKKNAHNFLEAVGTKNPNTHAWDNPHGYAIKHLNSFYGAITLPIMKAKQRNCDVKIIGTDIFYEVNFGKQYNTDMHWAEVRNGNLRFKGIGIGESLDNEIINLLGLGSTRRGRQYVLDDFNALDTDVLFASYWPARLDEPLRSLRERLIILAHNPSETVNDRNTRASAHPGNIFEYGCPRVVTTYIMDGRKALRVRHNYNPLSEQLENPEIRHINFAEMTAEPSAILPKTQEAALEQLFSAEQIIRRILATAIQETTDPRERAELEQLTSAEAIGKFIGRQSNSLTLLQQVYPQMVSAREVQQVALLKLLGFDGNALEELKEKLRSTIRDRRHLGPDVTSFSDEDMEIIYKGLDDKVQQAVVGLIDRQKAVETDKKRGEEARTALEKKLAEYNGSLERLNLFADSLKKADPRIEENGPTDIFTKFVSLMDADLKEKGRVIEWLKEENRKYAKLSHDFDEEALQKVVNERAVDIAKKHLLPLKQRAEALENEKARLEATIADLTRQRDTSDGAYHEYQELVKHDLETAKAEAAHYRRIVQSPLEEARKSLESELSQNEKRISELEEQASGKDKRIAELEILKSDYEKCVKELEEMKGTRETAASSYSEEIAQKKARIDELELAASSLKRNYHKAIYLSNIAMSKFDSAPDESLKTYLQAYEFAPFNETRMSIAGNIGGLLYNAARSSGKVADYRDALKWFRKSWRKDYAKQIGDCVAEINKPAT